jgi:hypothetical protein
VLKNGRMVQQGHHEELLRLTEGLYYRLYSDFFIPAVDSRAAAPVLVTEKK